MDGAAKEENICQNGEGCRNCKLWILTRPDDMDSPYASLGYRVWFTLISVLVLGFGINKGNSEYLKSVFIFVLPFAKEYMGFKPEQKNRECIRVFQMFFTVIIMLVSVFNLLDIVHVIVDIETSIGYIMVNPDWAILGGLKIKLITIWYMVFVCFLFTLLDYVIYKPKKTRVARVQEHEYESGV